MNAVVKLEPLKLAVNYALNEARLAQLRYSAAMGPGGIPLDAKRPRAWCEYGFPETISFDQFLSLYKRGGIAHGAVNKIVDACWKTSPWVIEGDPDENDDAETPWEKKAKAILSPRVWAWLKEADLRRMVGRFAAVLLHVADNGQWDLPVTRGSSAIEKLTPVWAAAIKPKDYDTAQGSPTFGQPTAWLYKEAGIGNAAGRELTIHPDRIFILGDWRSDAIGFLEPAYNAFVSLEKVEGGSGESFLKNAARQLSVSFDKEVDLAGIANMYGVKIDELHQKFNDAARDMNMGMDNLLISQGATTTSLVAQVSDPQPTYNVNLQTAACALDIPTKILVGMQTGERASTEDQKYFNGRCQGRRESQLRFELEDFVAHLIRIKVLPPVEPMSVMWDDMTEASTAERLTNAKLLADINNSALGLGAAIFNPGELREAAGYEPEAELMPLPEPPEPDDPQDEDDAGTGATR
jgi:hypothetical protein